MPETQNAGKSAKAAIQGATITPEAHEEHSAFPSHKSFAEHRALMRAS